MAGRHDHVIYRDFGVFAARRGRPRAIGDGRHVPDNYPGCAFTPRACNAVIAATVHHCTIKTRMTTSAPWKVLEKRGGERIKTAIRRGSRAVQRRRATAASDGQYAFSGAGAGKRLYRIVAMAQRGTVRNGRGNLKSKTEIVRSLRIPAIDSTAFGGA